MRPLACALAMASLLGSTCVWAVGLGPLQKSGVTAGPDKGFYLTITNPYPAARKFRAYVEPDTGIEASRVSILPAETAIAAGSSRRILVIIHSLTQGEEVQFRVCAEKVETGKVSIHARVCSRLGARRLRTAR